MTEVECPRAVRRTVAFCSSVFNGECEVEGVRAKSYHLDDVNILGNLDGNHIPVFIDPECEVRKIWQPDVVIDGRILKRNRDNTIGDAPLVIGYGPGLQAGKDVHYVVETNRGHDLGRIISSGLAAPDTGYPGEIAGQSARRVLRSPASGVLVAQRDIGDIVIPGDVVAVVEGSEIETTIGGVLRGLILPGSAVEPGQKVGDVDPRGKRENCYTISDKARTISGAALEIISAFNAGRNRF